LSFKAWVYGVVVGMIIWVILIVTVVEIFGWAK